MNQKYLKAELFRDSLYIKKSATFEGRAGFGIL